MFRRVLIYSAVGGSVIGTALSLHGNDYNVNSLGIVRLGRSAATVFDVALTYKKHLYYKEWDTNSQEYKKQKSIVHKIAAEKLLTLCCDNRGVYVKVGQHIGALEYLLPLEYVETMKILHSDAPKNPVEDLFKVIKQDLKKDVYDIFESFESEPLGTASLAQVHKAKLKTGETVAVKVQHPYVKGNSKVDMKTMEILVSIMAKVFPDFKIKWLVDETKINLPIELDFLHEGQNCEKIKEMFKKQFQWLRVPKIYWEHSSSRVLVMEYLEGGHVNDVKYLKDNKLDHFDVSSKIGQLYSEMIFVKGFVHSDPHPGNILVERSSVTGKADIILLDHGLYATLTPKFRYEYSKLWLSILNVDKTAMRKHSENLGIKGDLYGLFACMVTGRPWELVVQGIDRKRITDDEKELLQTSSSLVIPQLSDILEQVDRQMLLILKTNDLIRSIETTLGTKNRMTAFWVMSKCCIHSSYSNAIHRESNSLQKCLLKFSEQWAIFKLNIYYLYMGIINYGLFTSIKQLL